MKIMDCVGSVLFEDPKSTTVKDTIHAAVRAKVSLSRANLSGANLRGADLCWANLCEANLHGADSHGANLCEANLHGADLCWANLHGADLCWANLRGADLRWANLHGANLRGANLRGADLRKTYLHGADLLEANLRGAQFSRYESLLGCKWGVVSDELCVDLMDYDAANLENGIELFDRWARSETGACPFRNSNVGRSVFFVEKRHLWVSGREVIIPKTARELVQRLVREKCTNSDWHV